MPAARDQRHVVIPAPAAGGTLAPPPRQRRIVVEPSGPAGPPPNHRTPRRGSWSPRRRQVVRAALGAGVVLTLLAVVSLVWGIQQFGDIERVELSDVLASGNGTNYLIVGSDTREGISPDDPNAGAILGPEAPVGSERSDTILILRVDGSGARMLSVPRDLLVTIAETGQRTRINAAFNGGPRRLVATLTDQLGLPIHHYLAVDFVSFRDLVDALGGIVITFPYPAFDPKSGLDIATAGDVTLDGDQALAYVRSRYYTEIVDGREVPQGTGDLGRVVRQQQFLAAVVAKVSSVRNPLRLARITTAMVGGMTIDDDLTFVGALGLLWRFRSLDPTPHTLPTSHLTLSSGAQVLQLVQPGADEVLAAFGSPGAS